jgi:SpoVK/Ycf46/Vps4 family AAA+-type ATPase
MVLGATNRPNDIDSAILRRMPKRYAVGLPNPAQRKKILDIMLADTKLDKNFNLDKVVARSEGYSGSDLKEACRGAAMQPVREFMRSAEGREKISTAARAVKELGNGTESPLRASANRALSLRPLRNEDFFVVEGVNGRTTNQDALD